MVLLDMPAYSASGRIRVFTERTGSFNDFEVDFGAIVFVFGTCHYEIKLNKELLSTEDKLL